MQSVCSGFCVCDYNKNRGVGSQLADITQDSNGNLWMVGLLGQFYYFDGVETKSFTFPKDIFTNGIFRISADAAHRILLLTDRGLISFDGESYKLIALPKQFIYVMHNK